MIAGLEPHDLAGEPVWYQGSWWQPYYGPAGIVEFVQIDTDE